jgi:hypothetical protein
MDIQNIPCIHAWHFQNHHHIHRKPSISLHYIEATNRLSMIEAEWESGKFTGSYSGLMTGVSGRDGEIGQFLRVREDL